MGLLSGTPAQSLELDGIPLWLPPPWWPVGTWCLRGPQLPVEWRLAWGGGLSVLTGCNGPGRVSFQSLSGGGSGAAASPLLAHSVLLGSSSLQFPGRLWGQPQPGAASNPFPHASSSAKCLLPPSVLSQGFWRAGSLGLGTPCPPTHPLPLPPAPWLL